MTDSEPEPEPEPDAALGRLLQEWTVPALPDTLDHRVQALFRQRIQKRSLWRRLFATSIRVPLPVAVALLLILAAALWLPHRRRPELEMESAEKAEPTRSARAETAPTRHASLAGFEPVREMNVTVLPGGTP
jgi:hypothetical protein